MWPRRGFQRCVHAAEGAAEPSFLVRGRDAAAIAFLDGAGVRELETSPFEVLEPGLAAEVALLLEAGDPEPPLSLAGPTSLVTTLAERPYRGALAIIEPTVELDDDGAPLRVSFGVLHGRGGAGRGAQGPGLGAATDRKRYSVELGSDHATIVHWQRFRLTSPLDLRGRFNGADHAAFGWIKLSYVLWSDGRAELHCASSFIPSCWFYLDFVRAFRHDMLSSGAEEIELCLRPASGMPSGTHWRALEASTGYVHAVVA